ncbi:MAG: methyltransferase domain-containing protein [Candidatus Melainabacteria bacterium]|nr:methyltransferase domain-containing protein [Candidatus Melainabacteria bacterium]
MKVTRDKLLILDCGAVLMLTQYIAVREIGSSFFSTELITVAAVIMILIGPSIAYYLADRVGPRFLAFWGAVTFVSLLVMPFGIRALVAYLMSLNVEHVAMLVVFLGAGLFYSAFFAIFLPRMVRSGGDFVGLYCLELAGAVLALGLIALVPTWQLLLVAFYAFIVLALHLSVGSAALTIPACLASALVAFCYPALDAQAAQYYYRCYWNQKDPHLMAVTYSPYQRIDVVTEGKDRILYLDGIPYYDASDLYWFNYYIAELPGRLVADKGRALIVGSGSLSSTGYLVRQGFEVTTIEIDKKVADYGMKYFNDLNKLSASDFKLEIGDARRIIAGLPDRSYDLIVLDIPAPFHIQTALLYTPAFFGELNRCLKDGGIAAINTCSYKVDDPIARAIGASACKSFADLRAITGESLGLTILYCARKLPPAIESLREQARVQERQGFQIFDDRAFRAIVGDTRPHDSENLAALLLFAREHLPEVMK